MVTLLTNSAPMLAAEATAAVGRPIPDWAKGNTIFETFFKGGPIMYPMVAVLVVAVAVILERLVWWMVQIAQLVESPPRKPPAGRLRWKRERGSIRAKPYAPADLWNRGRG